MISTIHNSLAGAILRPRTCIECPTDPPRCTGCLARQVCTLTVQTCDKCVEAVCVDSPEDTTSPSKTKAIAGGVAGGLVGLALLIGVLLWYFFRHRRIRRLEQHGHRAAVGMDTMFTPPTPDMYRTKTVSTTSSSKSSTIGLSNVIPLIPGVYSLKEGSTVGSGMEQSSVFHSNESYANLCDRLEELTRKRLQPDTVEVESNAGHSILTLDRRERGSYFSA